MAKDLSLTFYNGAGTVTGANFLLQNDQKKILVDCGLLQGVPEAKEGNVAEFEYDPKSIDFLFITHAHMDHIGRVAKLVKEGFRGIIYSTPLTKTLAKLMLEDALRVMEMNSKDTGRDPLYQSHDVIQAFSLWQTISYHKMLDLGGGFSVYLKDAGHILGSSIIEFSYNGKKIVFTGDLGNSPSLLLKEAEDITDATYLVIDSVYGDRNHESKESRRNRLKKVILETIKKNGTLVIPAFSLERTQILLYELNEFIEGGEVPKIPVFLDSPLAIRVTEIYNQITENYNQDVKNDIASGDKIFDFPKLKETMKVQDSRQIDKTPNPKIIIAGSGMSTGGRVLHHEAEYLPHANNTVLLFGYQALGTLGRQLQEGAKEVLINEKKIPVKAKIELITGYSSHMDSDHLVEFVEKTKDTLKTAFVVMGEPKSSMFLAQRLREYLDVKAVIPERGKTYKLES